LTPRSRPRATESELLFTARLLSDRDFNDFSLGPFTLVQNQINALFLFAIDRTTTGHRLRYRDIVVVFAEPLLSTCVTTAIRIVPDTMSGYEEALDQFFFLRSRSINPDEPTAFLASEIGKWFRDLEISPGQPSESRMDWRTRYHINRRMHKYSARIVKSIPDVSVPDLAVKCFSTLNMFSTNESDS